MRTGVARQTADLQRKTEIVFDCSKTATPTTSHDLTEPQTRPGALTSAVSATVASAQNRPT